MNYELNELRIKLRNLQTYLTTVRFAFCLLSFIIFSPIFIGGQGVGYAQTTLTQAVDFTVTDTDGNTHHLFNYLDNNYYVVIDFFYVDCSACQTYAPYVNASYEHFGCNTSNVIFLAIDYGDNNADVIQFDATYGVDFPSVSGNHGGGNSVVSNYGIMAFPTVILIAPNHDIVEQDIWPATTSAINTAVTNAGGIAATCPTGISEEKLNITKTEIISISPNPVMSLANLTFNVKQETSLSLTVYNILGMKVKEMPQRTYNSGTYNVTLSLSDLSSGTYFINLTENSEVVDVMKVGVVK